MPAVAGKLAEFVERFNGREYRRALEPVEALWLAHRDDFTKGLIRVTVALRQLDSAGLTQSPRFLLATAESLLAPYAPRHLGMDVAGLLGFVARCREFVEDLARAGTGAPAPPPAYTIAFDPAAAAGSPAPAGRLPWYRRLFRRPGSGGP